VGPRPTRPTAIAVGLRSTRQRYRLGWKDISTNTWRFEPGDAGHSRRTSSFKGETMADVIALIEKDHREVEDLFSKFDGTQDASVATKICDELDRHATGEEKAVYPVIASDVPGGEQMAKEGEDEHKEARQLIGRIRQTSDPEHRAELVGELKQAVEHHVHEEESEILPKTRDALGQSRLDELGEEFEAAKS
jgi:hemerythrin superfamily protein